MPVRRMLPLISAILMSVAEAAEWTVRFINDRHEAETSRLCSELKPYLENGIPEKQRVAPAKMGVDTFNARPTSCDPAFRPERIVLNYFAGPDPVDAPLEFWENIGKVLMPERVDVYAFPSSSDPSRTLLVGFEYTPTICSKFTSDDAFREGLRERNLEAIATRCAAPPNDFAIVYSEARCQQGGIIDLFIQRGSKEPDDTGVSVLEHNETPYVLAVERQGENAVFYHPGPTSDIHLSQACRFERAKSEPEGKKSDRGRK